ncbi:MAG: four helix bundle protein [Acidobacteria bacterium]|nr:four helix bundle protein [Acidobacteriota bacterium]
MATFRRFEDLGVWKLAFECAELIYDVTENGEFARDYALRNQIRRAGVSIFSNIAEGFERDGNREFANFLSISKGSCGEARAQLVFAKRLNYIGEQRFLQLHRKLEETSRQLSRLRSYLVKTPMKGRRWEEDNY